MPHHIWDVLTENKLYVSKLMFYIVTKKYLQECVCSFVSYKFIF